MRLSRALALSLVCACAGAAPQGGEEDTDPSSVAVLALGSETACDLGERATPDCFGRYAVKIEGLAPLLAVAIGAGPGCAIDGAHRLICFGADPSSSAPMCFGGLPPILPVPARPDVPPAAAAECPPRAVELEGPVRNVWVGSTVGCARLMDDSVRCWGGGIIERLAPTNGSPERPRPVPILERTLREAFALALADDHGCILDRGARVRCFGDGTNGQLGDGAAEFRAEPAVVRGVENAVAVRVAEQRSCALTADGAVWCWGSRGLDNVEIDRRPVRIEAPERLSTLAISRMSGCGVSESRHVLCWGATMRGRIGVVESVPFHASLVPVSIFDGASDVATGIMYTCARRRGELVCSGEVPSAVRSELGPAFVEPGPAPASAHLPTPSTTVETACVADADCLLGGPGCCEPCGAWDVSQLSAFHRNSYRAFTARVCPEPMACPECAVEAPPADARCVDGQCRVVPHASVTQGR